MLRPTRTASRRCAGAIPLRILMVRTLDSASSRPGLSHPGAAGGCPCPSHPWFLAVQSLGAWAEAVRRKRPVVGTKEPRCMDRGSFGKEGDLLVAVGDDRGIEVVAGVVAAGGAQPPTGVNVLERTSFPLMLAEDFEILRAFVDGQLHVLAVASAN